MKENVALWEKILGEWRMIGVWQMKCVRGRGNTEERKTASGFGSQKTIGYPRPWKKKKKVFYFICFTDIVISVGLICKEKKHFFKEKLKTVNRTLTKTGF